MERTFGPIIDQLYDLQTDVGCAIIFCQKLDDCCKLYRFFRQKLGRRFTIPNGSHDFSCNRIVDMFHSFTEPCIKDSIINPFSSSSCCNCHYCFWYGRGHPWHKNHHTLWSTGRHRDICASCWSSWTQWQQLYSIISSKEGKTTCTWAYH